MPRKALNEDGSVDADFIAGIEEAKDKLASFLEKLHDDPDIEGDLTLQLLQVGMGSTAPIHTWNWAQSDGHIEMAEMIVDKAVEDGGALGSGKCKYAVTIDGRKGRCAFSLEFPEADEDDLDEPPTEKGQVALVMRHAQSLMGMVKHMFEATSKQSSRRESEMREEIASYRRGEVEHLKLFAEILDRRHERDIETKRLVKAEERKDELVNTLSKVGVPLLMSKLVGASAPGASTPMEIMMESMLKSFTPEQFQRMVQTGEIKLSQDQLFSFLHVLEAFVAKQDAEKGTQQQPAEGGQANSAPSPAQQQGT